jgi:hypothetical protein
VVIYNNSENLCIRIGTIPVEDVAYAFSMLLMSLVLIKKIENNFIPIKVLNPDRVELKK